MTHWFFLLCQPLSTSLRYVIWIGNFGNKLPVFRLLYAGVYMGRNKVHLVSWSSIECTAVYSQMTPTVEISPDLALSLSSNFDPHLIHSSLDPQESNGI